MDEYHYQQVHNQDDSSIQLELGEMNKQRLQSMQTNISTPPNLLANWAGKSSCCIFRIPQSFVDVNGSAYRPHIVSIGPFHRGQADFQVIEQHKWRLLGDLINRTKISLEQLFREIQPLENRARESYSEVIHLGSHEFIEMLLLDGCFIVEFFRKICKIVPIKSDDPLISMPWINSFFLRDLIRIENQIPFFIIQTLFDLTNITPVSDRSISSLALEFFNNSIQRPDKDLIKYNNLEGRHLLDLLRKTFITPGPDLIEPARENAIPAHVIQCISKLRRAGIAIKPGQGESFLEVKFRHGILYMPKITIDAFMSCFVVNCVAFEQCQRKCSKHFTTYTTLLDYLVNTKKDVEYLCEQSVIENYFGTEDEIANLFNNLGKEVSFDIKRCYMSKLFKEVDDYYKNNWHVTWETFRYTYFNSPWSAISAFAAILLLILSFLQTMYAMFAYINPPTPKP